MKKSREELKAAGFRWEMVLFVGLSLSIGWGIRGNFGHSYGAMIPGCLAAMAAAMASNREDWRRRVAFFGLFGAIGWGFGGSIAYMLVIAYAHSGHSLSVWYGFASLFVIGFLWGAIGGAGTGLPAYLNRQRLTEFIVPMTWVFTVWWFWDTYDSLRGSPLSSQFRQNDPFYWYDTDWIAAVAALVAVLSLRQIRLAYDAFREGVLPRALGYAALLVGWAALIAYFVHGGSAETIGSRALHDCWWVILVPGLIPLRGRFDEASKCILHLAFGWWAGFLILTVWLHLRMNPPRGDDWAGITGMCAGMLVYFERNGLRGLTLVSLIAGFIGGLGFSGGVLLELLEVTSKYETNWHSILEQTYGFINGIGIAVAMGIAATRAAKVSDDPPVRRWADAYAVFFIVVVITYINVIQEIEVDWIRAKTVPAQMYFLSAVNWGNLAYSGIALVAFLVLRAHLRRPLPLAPATWLGKGQAIYLIFMWWMITANLMKAVVAFQPQRLVTEGTIHVNGLICTVLLLLAVDARRLVAVKEPESYGPLIRKATVVGLTGGLGLVTLFWGVTRLVYGNRQSGHAGVHVRFGPNATVYEHPKKGEPHP